MPGSAGSWSPQPATPRPLRGAGAVGARAMEKVEGSFAPKDVELFVQLQSREAQVLGGVLEGLGRAGELPAPLGHAVPLVKGVDRVVLAQLQGREAQVLVGVVGGLARAGELLLPLDRD